MIFLRFLFLSMVLSVGVSASELSKVVGKFKAPTLESAKGVVENLEKLIELGDARTVTLSKKVHRSVKRIFKAEQQVTKASAAAGQREVRAKQLTKNAESWLKPNVHGKVNRGAADTAKREAKALLRESKEAQIASSKKWAEEVADFEKMLGDLEFSKEAEALQVLGEVLHAIVKRTSWVDLPLLKYNNARLSFLKNQSENREHWAILARHAAEAGDLDLAYDLYRKAGNEVAQFQVGVRLAERLTKEGFPGSALVLWETLGEEERVNKMRQDYPDFKVTSYRPLSRAALIRQATPACVRVSFPGGFSTCLLYTSPSPRD